MVTVGNERVDYLMSHQHKQHHHDSCCTDEDHSTTRHQHSHTEGELHHSGEGDCCHDGHCHDDAVPQADVKLQADRVLVYRVEGMDCSSCALTLEKHMRALPFVQQISVNFSTGKMQLVADGVTDGEIVKEVSKAGYQASPITKRAQQQDAAKPATSQTTTIISGVFLALGYLLSYTSVTPMVSTLLYAVSLLIAGVKPGRSAFYGIRSKSLDMNVLMTVAAIGAVCIGEWLEAATVVWLFALGNTLQTRSIEKTRESIRNLMNLTPTEAQVKQNGQIVAKSVEEVGIGAIIVVRPGDKVPLDGEIIEGISSINQAPITGESIPVDKKAGDAVFAGTINESGTLDIRVTKLVEDTAIARIIQLVEEAQEKKAPTQAFVDRFAHVYTPVVFVLAAAVMIVPPLIGVGAWLDWFYKGLELLVVACPCALVISTPVAIVSAIGNAAKNGVLIKGGTFLETAGKLTAIAFDKTGTLTEGKPSVTHVIALDITEVEVLSIAAAIERYSTHPVAVAINAYAAANNIAPAHGREAQAIAGKGAMAAIDGEVYYAGKPALFTEMGISTAGVEAQIGRLQEEGNTIILIGTATKLEGVIAVADTVREITVEALRKLKEVGIEQTVMLTGDNQGTAQKVASQTGVTRYMAELLPQDKVNAVKSLQREGSVVAMVGDGINDAPALATADIGIAMGGAGTDTAMETADIVLMADNLERLPHTIKLSRKAIRIIKENIWFSIIIKLLALILIFPGYLTLWIAVLSDTGAALIVILNSMRLLKMK
ncbi:cadmium-translocating P-type ATPase [Brevibacillus fluminis]|uniref:Cd(2+)-exporting ATPase n=2 Tax=Brevibacillus fluminis TaxID=511487 RepID=A0A3M8DAZ3_9BACL|nr:cadmium-translocating P-type ATPase [Brevibacillus fluminis]